MDVEVDSVKKRQQCILDCIEVFDFKNAHEHSKKLISQKGTIENTFRSGTKILSSLSNNLSKKEHLVACFELFQQWYDYCLDYKQNLLTRNNLLYYGVIYTKSLITERAYDLAFLMLDRIQKEYSFVCDMPPDPDNEKYIKYMAPLSYNGSLKKDLINEDPDTAMKLYVHGVKFYLKYHSNFYILLDSIRSIEISFVKYNMVEKLYAYFFEFIKESITIDKLNDCSEIKKNSNIGSQRKELVLLNKSIDDQLNKKIYLIKFYSALFLQYVSIVYNSNSSKEKTLINEQVPLKSYFLNEQFYSSLKRVDPDIAIIPKILEVFDQIIAFSNQFHKEIPKQSRQIKKDNIRNSELLKENSVIEIRLEKKLCEICDEILEKRSSSLYQVWILNYLFEILITGNSAIFNDPTLNSNFIQNTQLELLINTSILHAKTLKKLFIVHHHSDKMPKTVLIKPLSSFLVCEKVVEQSFKMNSEDKWINSEIGIQMCETLIKKHNSFIKWIFETNMITNEELNRVYNDLECQTIRLCSQFYSEDILVNYIRFQKLSFEIAIDRLKFVLMNKTDKYDYNVLKSFRNICENLLLSYRLKEKFEDAFESTKAIYDFLVDFELEINEIEWVVTVWCKIKRDLWKAKSKEHQQITIADYLNIKPKFADKFLLEEIRIYNSFKVLDSSVTMYDEIYHTLLKLESLTNLNTLLKCRIMLEISQFSLTYSKDTENKFKLSSEEYIEKAQVLLNSHQCLSSSSINDLIDDIRSIKIEDKENKSGISTPNKCNATPIRIEPLSPNNNQLESICTTKKNSKQTLNRRRKLQSTRSPMISKTGTPSCTKQCNCVSSLTLQFQLDLFKALNEYAKCRNKMAQYVSSLIQSRSKVKENVTTNADQIQMQSMSSSCLICPELCDENTLNLNDDHLMAQLDSSLNLLEKLANDKTQKENFIKQERSFKKQFFESVDLLAQLYGFFGFAKKRIEVFHLKIELLNFEFELNIELALIDFESVYANVLLQLMKAYLNLSMCDEFVVLLFSKKLINPDPFKMNIEFNEDLNKKLKNVKPLKIPNAQISYSDLDSIDRVNKVLTHKTETQVVYNLVIAHYFILKHKTEDAIKLIKTKIMTSNVLSGKQTAYYYEIKYHLRYLQFLLSMSNVGKYEPKLNEIIENETPLSLLEECYTSSFSVARYYLQSSFEPSRALNDNNNNNKQKDEPFFFNIGNSECYRILSESLDIMQEACKYYIEISRYRDALGYIREGLDITQMHFSIRRVSLFLLHQINADLVASCITEASSRINIAKNLIGYSDLDQDLNELQILNDLNRCKNIFYLKNLKMAKDIKLAEQPDSDSLIDSNKLCENFNTIQSFLSHHKTLDDFLINLTIEGYFILCNYFIRSSKTNKETVTLMKKLKEILLKSPESKPTSLNERWHFAQYFCLSYELDSNLTNLNSAFTMIKSNPQPTLYRRICFHLFESEKSNSKLKIEYLLETQSIALRHKACSIQIKNKRKSLIDLTQFERITSSLFFNTHKPLSLFDKIEKSLPSNFVVVSLILINFTDLHLVRLEAGTEPLTYKLKYDRKYTEEFKQIITENDKSMKQSDRNKFWTTRSLLNSRLSAFTEEIEKNVLSFAKPLLMGSFKQFNMEKFIDRLKNDLNLGAISKIHHDLIKIVALGVDILDSKEMKEALRTEFDETIADLISAYVLEKKSKMASLKRKHVCLLVDKHLHQIPWESLPTAKKQAITRMPSIHFLLSHLRVNKLTINKENAFYIVDPGGDLIYTKQKFQPFFEKKKSWKGLVGIAPDENQFKTALTEYELFIYTGHGSGSQYYPSDEVQKLRIQACSILMGCSSGNQYVLGDFEPYGTVLAYIIAGCPCIVGNLWDVTDRDIDRLTEEFLDSWLKDIEDEPENPIDNESAICMSLNKARNGCKMTFLNGSAPIVYGLPIN